MKYKVGQILTSNCDTEVEKALSGEKVIIPKGDKIIIGADELVHYFKNYMIQPLQKEDVVEGYDANGIAEFIFRWLSSATPIIDMLEDYNMDKSDFIQEIEYALNEIGF